MEEFTGPTDYSTTEQSALFEVSPGNEAPSETNLESESGSDDKAGHYCEFCDRRVSREDPTTYEEVTSWVHGAKKDSAVLRTRTGRLACGDCISKLRAGISPGQPDLEILLDVLPETSYVDSTPIERDPEYDKGFNAGYSGEPAIPDNIDAVDSAAAWHLGYSDGEAQRKSEKWLKPLNPK